MTTQTIASPPVEAQPDDGALPANAPPPRRGRGVPVALILLPLAALAALLIHRLTPNHQTDLPTHLYPMLLVALGGVGILVLALHLIWGRTQAVAIVAGGGQTEYSMAAVSRWFTAKAPLATAGICVLCIWDLITLKLALVPLPFFPGPDMILQCLRDDWPLIFNCTWHSLLLLFCGYSLGAIAGVTSGVLIGWSSNWRYWGMPVLKVIGPIPATAFIPLALMLFTSAFAAGTALIALAVWFPVAMLTTSGVANVRKPLIDVARTLGAGTSYLIFRVAIPAALPSIFVGLFMGLGTSFITLNVAETVGVPSGLGWYITWAKEYADYPKVYAALVIMAVFFSGIITLLFKVRDRVLVYQKGTLKW
ncbi:MAG TPA: ABC transporter permease [Tepidisphaeraceae bacterium]|jgi:NitT/TauT family transport system permease protein|nr:ABC transporter permease [Tepidisphaeraceae bacterium]